MDLLRPVSSVSAIFYKVGWREETDSFKRSSARNFKRLYGVDGCEAETEDGSPLLRASFNAMLRIRMFLDLLDPDPDPSVI
jgi:hypothetical protein